MFYRSRKSDNFTRSDEMIDLSTLSQKLEDDLIEREKRKKSVKLHLERNSIQSKFSH
jgi:hypothetical protein